MIKVGIGLVIRSENFRCMSACEKQLTIAGRSKHNMTVTPAIIRRKFDKYPIINIERLDSSIVR